MLTILVRENPKNVRIRNRRNDSHHLHHCLPREENLTRRPTPQIGVSKTRKHSSAKSRQKAFELPNLAIGDVLLVGKFKNRKATITGFSSDENNQPVAQTDKGDQKIFRPRIAKLMPPNAEYLNVNADPSDPSSARNKFGLFRSSERRPALSRTTAGR